MKKTLFVLITTFSLFCCSNDTIEPNSEKQDQDFEIQAKDFLCGPGYHLEFTVFDELRLFKKKGCDDGFGFCFGIRLNIAFDCVRNTVTSSPNNQNVYYDDTTKYAKSLGIADPISKEITFYFHEDITNSPDHDPSDFNVLDVEDGVLLNNNITLVGGTYTKIIDGDYFKYIVPYIEK